MKKTRKIVSTEKLRDQKDKTLNKCPIAYNVYKLDNSQNVQIISEFFFNDGTLGLISHFTHNLSLPYTVSIVITMVNHLFKLILITELIRDIKNEKSVELDEISTYAIMCIFDIIARPLTFSTSNRYTKDLLWTSSKLHLLS